MSDELCPCGAEHPSPRKAHLSFCRLHKQCRCCLGLSCRIRSMLYKRRPPRWWVWARRWRNKRMAVTLSRLPGCSLLRQNQAYPDTDSLRPGCLSLPGFTPTKSYSSPRNTQCAVHASALISSVGLNFCLYVQDLDTRYSKNPNTN